MLPWIYGGVLVGANLFWGAPPMFHVKHMTNLSTFGIH